MGHPNVYSDPLFRYVFVYCLLDDCLFHCVLLAYSCCIMLFTNIKILLFFILSLLVSDLGDFAMSVSYSQILFLGCDPFNQSVNKGRASTLHSHHVGRMRRTRETLVILTIPRWLMSPGADSVVTADTQNNELLL